MHNAVQTSLSLDICFPNLPLLKWRHFANKHLPFSQIKNLLFDNLPHLPQFQRTCAIGSDNEQKKYHFLVTGNNDGVSINLNSGNA